MDQMTDRELLELAAKAVGYDTSHSMNAERLLLTPPVDALLVRKDGKLVTTGWNPLKDDGDALRLAMELGISINLRTTSDGNKGWRKGVLCHDENEVAFAYEVGGNCASARSAIVRAAAEIGKSMQ